MTETSHRTRDPPKEWYYKNEIDSTTTIYSLLNSNTKKGNSDMVKYSKDFRESLKTGVTEDNNQMFSYLLNQMSLIPELKEINYWGIYPSSDGLIKNTLDLFKTQGENLSDSYTQEPILLRTNISDKRNCKLPFVRIKEGCDLQLDSIIVNPYYREKIPGASVGIIDDYSTYGTSAESTRHLLNKADVGKLTFLTLGKFGQDYYQYDYGIEGDVFGEYNYTRSKNRNSAMPVGEINEDSTTSFLKYMKVIST